MSAGLPGVGLSGLFVLITALLMPLVELGRTLAGCSSWARWRFVGMHWVQAVGMVLIYLGFARLLTAGAHHLLGNQAHSLSRLAPRGTNAAMVVSVGSLAVLAVLLTVGTIAARLVRPPTPSDEAANGSN